MTYGIFPLKTFFIRPWFYEKHAIQMGFSENLRNIFNKVLFLLILRNDDVATCV